jgi:hypothetical protein
MLRAYLLDRKTLGRSRQALTECSQLTALRFEQSSTLGIALASQPLLSIRYILGSDGIKLKALLFQVMNRAEFLAGLSPNDEPVHHPSYLSNKTKKAHFLPATRNDLYSK